MPRFIVLGNFTEQGIKNIKDVSKRDESARRMIEESGGKMQLYYTLGEYDFIAIIELPKDENIVEFLFQIGSLGNVRTKTLKAWSESEISDIASLIP
ncbi:MAG: GYD domain-containing protein [Candidatus Bathyarchaeota archaeon]|nr:GYD domain-containing protein [Candidatus Bathyarchaeota archaeon]